MVRLTLLTALVVALTGCAITEVPLGHDNPLDRIYDSGPFRMVLTAEAKSATLTQLFWSDVYHNSDGKLSSEQLILNPNATVLRSASAPSASDISAVKNRQPVSGAFAAVGECSVQVAGNGYAGNCDVTSAPKGYFVIRFSYRYTGNTNPGSGIFYSNIVVVQ